MLPRIILSRDPSLSLSTCLEGDGVARWYLEPDRPLGARFRGQALLVYGDFVDPPGETSVKSDLQ